MGSFWMKNLMKKQFQKQSCKLRRRQQASFLIRKREGWKKGILLHSTHIRLGGVAMGNGLRESSKK